MAIKLRIRDNSVKLKVGEGDGIRLRATVGVPIYPETYTGETTVTPSEEVQTLSTSGRVVLDNITVNPIPSNYGLITYNGSTITVS